MSPEKPPLRPPTGRIVRTMVLMVAAGLSIAATVYLGICALSRGNAVLFIPTGICLVASVVFSVKAARSAVPKGETAYDPP